ncbi:polyketide cyclase [Amorphoplanes nipponensis]|uniref:Polyketide cyclase n=1 Tax=Actinoplanes nipponensis TaxID=135950 RepID=A0A919MF97_9ACTN|nr:SRPBCC domain-containing protein [Actinoplanes nipponensis]GIE47299.1 polyketide cyclase [Actinoplanes nipponensis]
MTGHSDAGWPAGLDPREVPVGAYNELTVPATAEQVWHRLVDARAWPQWYANARHVVLDGGAVLLGPGTRFRWTTFGVRVTCRVEVCLPFRELAWSGQVLGSRGYHRWLLEPLPDGRTRVVTEEAQRGLLPTVARARLRRGLRHWHQRWLEGLVPGPPP